MRYGRADWDEVVEALRGAPSVAIACHVNPDGDALGSLFAAALGLAKRGAQTYPTWAEDPPSVPPSYAFLPGRSLLVKPEDVPTTEVFLALDCGAADRLGELREVAQRADRLINVDHHPGNEHFGHLNVVAPSASSTSEIVTHLLRDVGVELDRDIATCLYAGIVTDTGRFQYSNASPDTLRLAADLLAYGVDAPLLAQEVFDSAPFWYLKLLGKVLERATLHEDKRFVYSWILLEDLERAGVAMNETEKLVDALRATRDADVAAMFKQQPDGRFRVSLRSKGPVSVGEIARVHGGGGHELAAGFTADDIEVAVGAIAEDL